VIDRATLATQYAKPIDPSAPSHECRVCGEVARPWGNPLDLWKCGSCGFLQLDPLPDNSELAQIYSQQYYDSWGENESENLYWEMKKALFRQLVDYSGVQLIMNSDSRNALDVGCATGACLSVFQERGFMAYGIDVNSYAVEKARARNPGAKIYHGALETATLDPSSFSLMVMSDVVEHVQDPERFLRGAYRLLAPGGRLVILTPNIDSLSLWFLGAKWPHFKREHLCYFNAHSLRTILTQCGFRMVKNGSARKPINFAYAVRQFSTYPMPVVSGIMRLMDKLVRGAARTYHFFLPMGELLAVAEKPIDDRRAT